MKAAFAQTVERFGGLDMLVLNAGIFPSGCRIDSLQMDEWRRVLSINLDANLILMREAYPLLKVAKNKGRVVVNGSRNALAPGPGAAAYSTSKAALTQLARVAALEWAKDGIRVNIMHAHAIFDTGLWTPEVLQARADHYGMTVEEYKSNNLLKTEVSSRDFGEMVGGTVRPDLRQDDRRAGADRWWQRPRDLARAKYAKRAKGEKACRVNGMTAKPRPAAAIRSNCGCTPRACWGRNPRWCCTAAAIPRSRR